MNQRGSSQSGEHPNRSLVGVPGSRACLVTPALVVDLDLLEANLKLMVEYAARHDQKLRPHAKTHKSARIAKLQLEAGAIGVCYAKLSEAEALAAEGVGRIHIISPVVQPTKIERLVALNDSARTKDLMVVVDHPANAQALSAASSRRGGRPLDVIVDLGMGGKRTGIDTPEDAVKLALLVDHLPHLRRRELQAYAGHLQHIIEHEERLAAAAVQHARIRDTVAAMTGAGVKPEIVTGSGTGTFDLDTAERIFTDIQVGSLSSWIPNTMR